MSRREQFEITRPDGVVVVVDRDIDTGEQTVTAKDGSDLGSVSDAPDESWKVAGLKSWAETHDVDLGGARSKADILAAILDPDNAKTVSPDEGLPVVPADPSIEQTDLPE